MEPAQRKMKILEAVVEAYIRTGEPVGSKTLCESLEFNVSSATIRNDMAELASIGLLEQTHTSSGRIPTELGYRIYVDKLMKDVPLTKYEKSHIDNALYLGSDAPEHLLESAAALLSEMTKYASVASAPLGDEAVIRNIRFVQTGRYTAMIVLITSTGSVKTGLFRCEYVVTPEIIDMFEKTMNERFAGMSVKGVTPAFMQSAAASLGDMSMLLSNVLLAVSDTAKQAADTGVFIKGQSNLFLMPQLTSASGKRVMELLGHSSELSRLIRSAETKASVLIGSEMNDPALRDLSIVVSRYEANPCCCGMLAVIGPVRMNYPKVTAALEYTADTVGRLLREFLEID